MPDRRRPGFPRKTKHPNRLTPRVAQPFLDWVNGECARRNATQREVFEDVITMYLDEKPTIDHVPDESAPVGRTSIWFDPTILARMDRQEKIEQGSQRQLLERALLYAQQQTRVN